ncbi:hypothetical protein VOLCADRAFT_104604 [Volvox carteri f. nagariensis]|uniref:U2 snRNP-associated SURP motif-containing protein n=1 Tax=Volvox carteri f. nagariensis TaxID=3068 RepID=D8TUT6_VOLCA|nr:uncharacterized protein VOLCADRAFT_104604 [Volvox carteri f. nagariensis]EFJ48766.1 hypothetical protein VOLCADRAFT_104604 [Volvox carteri f. nagariensis]|eukprot:XP_002950098.1 hypothetical protein VOLCADRAFT_104604 [Volvox carteri f. nagariensis]
MSLAGELCWLCRGDLLAMGWVKADEEAARVYEEFVESFKTEDEPAKRGGTGFVRGGTVLPGSKPTEAPIGLSSKKSTKYVPSFLPPSALDAPPKPKAFDDADESVFQAPAKKTEKDKPRNIDKMLEQLKREQELRELKAQQGSDAPSDSLIGGLGGGNGLGGGGGMGAGPGAVAAGGLGGIAAAAAAAAAGFGAAGAGFRGPMMGAGPGAGGSFDHGDPFTTNLYVGNLAPEVDEEVLKIEFGRFGAIASVKVMWPRDEEQRRKGRNCGFVAFMRRDDAETAMRKLNGITLHGNELHIGWGKAIPLPAIPIYDPREGAVVSAIPAAATRPAHLLPDLVIPKKAYNDDINLHRGTGSDIEIKVPEDARLRFIIDTLALYVLQDGCALEQAVMEAEQKNFDFAFLFDLKSSEHMYYRWRLHSLSEGDTLRTWRIEPYVMVHGGQRWVPPPMTTLAEPVVVDDRTAAQKGGPDGGADGRPRERERQLTDSERDRFEDMLRFLTVERSDICEAMMFCLASADACGELVDILAESLSLAETAVPLKIARLFLLSDLLHNATAPVRNASRYRAKLQAVLPDIFESLNETYRNAEGRMLQEALRRHVLRVLRCWRERYIFTDDYLNGLQATFLQTATSAAAALADNPTMRAELEATADEELDRRAKLNGLSTRGGKEAMIHRFLILDHYLHADSRPLFDPSRQAAGAASGSVAASGAGDPFAPPLPPPPQLQQVSVSIKQEDLGAGAGPDPGFGAPSAVPAPAIPQSRWTTVDEEEERQNAPQIPISKWLLQEQEADARLAALQQQLKELDGDGGGPGGGPGSLGGSGVGPGAGGKGAGGGDDDDKIFSDDDDDGGGGGGAAAARSDPAADAAAAAAEEERRRRLREVELAVARLEAELEEEGLSKEEMASRLAAKRAELVGELDKEQAAKTAVLDKWRSRRGSAAAADVGPASSSHGQSEPGSSGRDRERERDRDRSDRSDRRDRDREKKDREKDKEREKERRRSSHSRSRSRGRSEREEKREREKERRRSRSRSRSRDRSEREKERERRRSRSRSRDRERERERSSKRSRSRSRGREKDKKSRR